jgi:putative transposase
MREGVRFSGVLKRVTVSATVSRAADRWFASVVVNTPDIQLVIVVGVVLGVTTLAILSQGEPITGPNAKYGRKGRRKTGKQMACHFRHAI